MSEQKTTNTRNILLILLAAVLVLFSISGAFDNLLQEEHGLATPASHYLAVERQHAEDFLIVIAATDEILNLARSSDAGVSFIVQANVRIGESISALAAAVDKMVVVSIASTAGLAMLSMVLTLAGHLAKLAFILFAAIFLVHRVVIFLDLPAVAPGTLRLAKYTFVLVLTVHLVIPGAIYLSASASNVLTGDTKEEAREHFRNIHGEMASERRGHDLKSSVKGTVSTLASHHAKGQHRSGNAVVHFTRFVGAQIFDLLVLPFAFLALMAYGLRAMVARSPTGELPPQLQRILLAEEQRVVNEVREHSA